MNDRWTTRVVGVVSGLVGLGLTVRPHESGRALGLSSSVSVLRGLGVVDLAVAAALLRPGAGWRPMAWRSALNVAICSMYLGPPVESPQPSARSRLGLASMSVVTVFDGALTMRRRRHARLSPEVSP